MSGSIRSLVIAGAVAVLPLAPAALRAQTAQAPAPSVAQGAATDSMAFPRQFVKWAFGGQGDSAFAHAGTRLRESMQSADGVNAMATRIQTRFGQMQGTDAEVQFDDGPLKVYIAVVRLAQAPEPGAWVVAYAPGTRVAERAAFSPLSSVKTRYPNAKLP